MNIKLIYKLASKTHIFSSREWDCQFYLILFIFINIISCKEPDRKTIIIYIEHLTRKTFLVQISLMYMKYANVRYNYWLNVTLKEKIREIFKIQFNVVYCFPKATKPISFKRSTTNQLLTLLTFLMTHSARTYFCYINQHRYQHNLYWN